MFQLNVKNYFCRVKSDEVSYRSLIKRKKQLFSYIFKMVVREEGIIEVCCLQTGCISSLSFNEKNSFFQKFVSFQFCKLRIHLLANTAYQYITNKKNT